MNRSSTQRRAPLRRRFSVHPGVTASWVCDALDLVKPHPVKDAAMARRICTELEIGWIANVARWMEQEWKR